MRALRKIFTATSLATLSIGSAAEAAPIHAVCVTLSGISGQGLAKHTYAFGVNANVENGKINRFSVLGDVPPELKAIDALCGAKPTECYANFSAKGSFTISFSDLAAAQFEKDYYSAFTKTRNSRGQMVRQDGMMGTGRCYISSGYLDRMPF